jgi:hypothetical protein
LREERENIDFGQHDILGFFARIQKTRDRNNNIPGGSLGPGVLLESGHIVQRKWHSALGFNESSHWVDKRILEIERKTDSPLGRVGAVSEVELLEPAAEVGCCCC